MSSLSDPLGIMVESVSDGIVKSVSIERDAESVQITIQDEKDHANRTQQSTISFQDIYQAYRSVPQVSSGLGIVFSDRLNRPITILASAIAF